MDRLSTWSKVNILLASIFLIVGFIKPILIEEFNYKGKMREAESVVENITKNQNISYTQSKKYIKTSMNEQSSIPQKYQVGKESLKYYNYIVTADGKGFRVVAEPKVEFIKKREVAPKIYRYSYSSESGKSSGSWSDI